MADSSAAPTGVNSARLASMSPHGSPHGSQGPMVSGNAGQEYNAFVDIGGDVGRDIINKAGLDNVVAVFSTDSTDLKIIFDSVGQAWGFNMNSGGLPTKITTLSPNDRVTQELALASYSVWKEQGGQQH
jgi:hypothetical protein